MKSPPTPTTFNEVDDTPHPTHNTNYTTGYPLPLQPGTCPPWPHLSSFTVVSVINSV